MRRIAAALLFVFFLICCVIRPALAQEGSATLTGFIQDSSKAVIPGVKVTAIDTNTNQRFDATTGKDGSYTIVALPVGPYQMQIEKPGFKTILKDDLFLHTQDALEVNFQMAVGSTSETVTVNGATTNDSPAVSMTVDREVVENMPLNGRSFQDLIQLAPGTVSANNSAANTGYYSIDGQRTDSNNYTVDGVSANLGGYLNDAVIGAGYSAASLSGNTPSQTVLGTTQNIASIDSLQEFTIQTSGYSAEYGRNPGGQVQFTTRSGTNDVHGSLFEFIRNTAFDANSDSNDNFGVSKTAEHQNDFGGTVGGPVIVPKLYDGQDKTFYFFSYEGLRLLTPATETRNVPTPALRASAAPGVQSFLDSAPLPNGPNHGDGCTVDGTPTGSPCDALFSYGYSNPQTLDNISLRVDQNLSKRVHAFVRYADTPSSQVSGAEIVGTSAINAHSWTAGMTANISGNLIDDLRFNSSRDSEQYVGSQKSVGGSVPWATNLLIPAAYYSPEDYGAFSLSLPKYSWGTYVGGADTVQHQYQVIDSLTWTRGSHSFKFGVDWRRLAPTYAADPYYSHLTVVGLSGLQQGYGSLQIRRASPGQALLNNISLYAQDHWKVGSRLSVDYGLRWEFNPPPGPSNGLYPVTLTSSDLATATLTDDHTQPYRTNYHSFAPRIGFAWNAIPSQSHPLTIRGGFGIFFDTGESTVLEGYTSGYPFDVTAPVISNVPLPVPNGDLAPPSLNAPLTPPYSYQQVTDPGLTLPYTEQWNLSVDEKLNAKNTLTASYAGNNGRKLLFTGYYNPGGSALNPDFANGVNFTYNGSQSSYNSLQVVDTGRIANGLELVASFTWAHALDNASGEESGVLPLYGNSDNDIRRMLNLALNYQIPSTASNGWSRVLTQGWLVANRFSTQSGVPTGIYQAPFEAIIANGLDEFFLPDRVPGVPVYLHGAATSGCSMPPAPGNWCLNPNAFASVPLDPTTGNPVRQGTLGRNYIRIPPFWTLNTAVQRSFPIYERLRMNFRAEAFNVFNHPNLGNVDLGIGDSTFGELLYGIVDTIGSSNSFYAMGSARSLQFSLHLQF